MGALALQSHVGWMVDRLLAPPSIADAFGRWRIQIQMLRISDGEDFDEKEKLVETVTDLTKQIASLTATLKKALEGSQRLCAASPPQITLPPKVAEALKAMTEKAAT